MFIAEWLAELLERRADKSWQPHLFAHPNIAARVKVLCNCPVEKDPKLSERAIEVRNGDGEIMATYEGVIVEKN